MKVFSRCLFWGAMYAFLFSLVVVVMKLPESCLAIFLFSGACIGVLEGLFSDKLRPNLVQGFFWTFPAIGVLFALVLTCK